MKNKALIIIDMQYDFVDYHNCRSRIQRMYKSRILSIRKSIRFAKNNLWNIIVVEYRGYGPTLVDIKDEIGSYKYHTCMKSENDGTPSLSRLFKRLKITEAYYCGCNADACVLDTWRGMRGENYSHGVPNCRHVVYVPGSMTFDCRTIRANSTNVIKEYYYSIFSKSHGAVNRGYISLRLAA